jgi:hypothetical protein
VDGHIRDALVATNKLLCDHPMDPELHRKLDTKLFTTNMRKIVAKWCEDPNCQDCCDGALGHTERKNTTIIFLNHQLKRLCDKGGDTGTRTKFIMAVTIYHEISHLLLRWQKLDNTPTKFRGRYDMHPEAGEYSELRALGGVVQLEVVDHRSKKHKIPRSASSI